MDREVRPFVTMLPHERTQQLCLISGPWCMLGICFRHVVLAALHTVQVAVLALPHRSCRDHVHDTRPGRPSIGCVARHAGAELLELYWCPLLVLWHSYYGRNVTLRFCVNKCVLYNYTHISDETVCLHISQH